MTNKAKLHEGLKLRKTPPLPRSTLKTSWQLPSSPRPRNIKSGGWWRRRRGNYGKWKCAARSTSSSLAEQRQVGHFYPLSPLDPDRPLFFSGLFFGASCLHFTVLRPRNISIFNYLCVDYLWFVGVVCWTLTGQLQSSNSIKEFSHEQPPPPNASVLERISKGFSLCKDADGASFVSIDSSINWSRRRAKISLVASLIHYHSSYRKDVLLQTFS